jgi:hypothetical protein
MNLLSVYSGGSGCTHLHPKFPTPTPNTIYYILLLFLYCSYMWSESFEECEDLGNVSMICDMWNGMSHQRVASHVPKSWSSGWGGEIDCCRIVMERKQSWIEPLKGLIEGTVNAEVSSLSSRRTGQKKASRYEDEPSPFRIKSARPGRKSNPELSAYKAVSF